MAGIVDMNPTDPIEGMLISQLVVAHEAALSLYRRAWACDPADYFEAHTKYLQLADKASRTVALLTERLDQHRGRGQQQITVKHVTVNADQAVVTDQIISSRDEEDSTAALLASGTEKPMEVLEQTHAEAVPIADEVSPMDKAHNAPRCTARSKRSGQRCRAPAVRGWRVCRMHGARGGAPEGERNGNYRHGARTKEAIELRKLIRALRRGVPDQLLAKA
jgi:hypothetical protein